LYLLTMLKISRTILFAAVLWFQASAAVLYMNGGYSSIEYHLGVLSEIERFQIQIDTVVGSEWGAFAGALWSAGWTSAQIRELVKSWDSLPKAEQPQKTALWQKEWLIKHREDGAPFLVEITESKPYFGQVFFDLRVQESLWRSDIGSKTPFRKIDSTENYPFPPVSSGEQTPIRIFSTPIALRDTNGTAAERYQQKLWQDDSTLIILRPHSKPNPDSLFEAGIQAAQARRSRLSQVPLNSQLRALNYQLSPPPPRFLYHPVFDSVPAEIQGHLKSFWNPGDTGILVVRNFLKNLQEDGSYREVNLLLDSGSFLQINSESSPQLSLALIGFGGTLFGANIAANANFRFVNQFGYDLNLMAYYGQGAKGLEPDLRFERFFMADGDFFAKAKFYEYEPTSFFQKRIYEKARLLKESGGGIVLGIEKERLQIAVEIERRGITSGASGFPIYDNKDIFWDDEDDEPRPIAIIYESVEVSSMFPYAKWLWQSEKYDRWFAKEGFMVQLTGGFKAVSVHASDQEAPLYVSSQGVLSITHSLSDYVFIGGGMEFGANFRRTDRGKFVLPSELYGIDFFDPDPALGNRYRFAMGMGSYAQEWQTPSNSSHLYGLVHAGLSLQWQGSGIFLAGGFAKDGEPNPWSDMEAKRLFLEPKIRVKMKTFDFVFGRSQIYSLENYAKITKNGEKRIFLSLQSGFFD